MPKASATLTIRNVPLRVVRSLKSIAKGHHRSMEQEVRHLLEEYVGERAAVVGQIEGSRESQSRRPFAAEIEQWISEGRR
jgi:plasmid stability protein